MSGYQSSNFAGEIWLQWFGCCTHQPGQQRKRQAVQRSRARIDRSMISYPTNFQHTVHIGSGDLEIESSHLDALQGQMQSKGGYGKAYIVKVCRLEPGRMKGSAFCGREKSTGGVAVLMEMAFRPVEIRSISLQSPNQEMSNKVIGVTSQQMDLFLLTSMLDCNAAYSQRNLETGKTKNLQGSTDGSQNNDK